MTTRFFLCKRCGNVIIKIVDSGVVPVCCGEEMVELRPNRTDVGMEKHVPVVECKSAMKKKQLYSSCIFTKLLAAPK